jgi:hypothetical protein
MTGRNISIFAYSAGREGFSFGDIRLPARMAHPWSSTKQQGIFQKDGPRRKKTVTMQVVGGMQQSTSVAAATRRLDLVLSPQPTGRAHRFASATARS